MNWLIPVHGYHYIRAYLYIPPISATHFFVSWKIFPPNYHGIASGTPCSFCHRQGARSTRFMTLATHWRGEAAGKNKRPIEIYEEHTHIYIYTWGTYPPTPAFAKAGAAPGTTGGVDPVFLEPLPRPTLQAKDTTRPQQWLKSTPRPQQWLLL